MKQFLIAVQFLTRLPTPRVAGDMADFAASMRWFPLVGVVIGLIVAGAAWLGLRIDGWTGALAALLAWVGITGALHLDGLADIADGLGAAHGDRNRMLTAMADPHVGSFGVVAIGLQLSAKLVLLHALLGLGAPWWLIPIPFAARIGPLIWTRWMPQLHEGLGARFTNAVRVRDIAIWWALLLVVSAVLPGLLSVALLIAAWRFYLLHKVGGISGDGHGAGIELVETGLILALLTAGLL